MTLVSVVIPTKNRPALLTQAIDSVAAQTGVELDLIVVDDGSSPALTPGIGSGLQLRVIRHPASIGVAAARNTGLQHSRGEWIAWLDDDDLYAPARLERLVQYAEKADADFAYSSAIVVDSALNDLRVDAAPSSDRLRRDLARVSPVPGGGSGFFIRRDLALECNGFNESFSFAADWELWLRLTTRATGAAVQEPLLAYRLHARSWTLADKSEIANDFQKLSDQYPAVCPASIDSMVAHTQWWAGERMRPFVGHLAAARIGRNPRALAHAARSLLSVTAARRLRLLEPAPACPYWLRELRARSLPA